MIDVGTVYVIACFEVVLGIYIGVQIEAYRWRSKGDHEYMNRCESRGCLYNVKREN